MTQHNNLKTFIKKGIVINTLNAAIHTIAPSHQRWYYALGFGLALGGLAFTSVSAHAMSESSVQAYVVAMNQAANSQNIGQISRLIADDAIIKMTRNGVSADLGKTAYLQHLQKSWAKATGYHYDIRISDIVVMGNRASAQVVTTESWTEDGVAVKLITTSKITLSESGSNAILLRSSSQVVIN